MKEGRYMISEQEIFWKEIQKIQNSVVNVTMAKISKYDDTEKLLNDVTYDTIYGMMELLDGHKNNALRFEIRDVNSGNFINSNIELHNYCEEYLKYSEI